MVKALESSGPRVSTGTYEDVAREYYDEKRHPTCANFREGSLVLLAGWLGRYLDQGSIVLEIGVGRSVFLDLGPTVVSRLGRLILADRSSAMLRYSHHGLRKALRVQGDAISLPFESGSLNIIVASLGDPYNVPLFWQEAKRVLCKEGLVLFTTPSYNWAVSFRSEATAPFATAEFDLADGRSLAVPSVILSEARQEELIESSGLTPREVGHFADRELGECIKSPKLRKGTVVTGYLACKR